MSDQTNNQTSIQAGSQGQAFDKVDVHNRQQLSALMDGALAPDEARFLLRRLQHDGELSECWERWQLAGEVMRGRATAVLPHGFAARVGEAIVADARLASKTPAQSRTRWARWGGSVALAASVAVVALLATRQAPNGPGQAAPNMVADTTPAPAVESPALSTASPTPAVTQQASAGSTVASVAVADVPRRAVQRGRAAQRPRTGTRAPIATTEAARTEVALVPTAPPAPTQRPFDAGTLPSSRPWPRAVLPQFGASGALTAGADSTTSPSFYPFEPRLPGGDAAEPDATPLQPR